jgi:group II intron reverse transcriptase/maturase
VYHPTNLKQAWEKVKANKGSGGIDKITLEQFEENLDEQIENIHIALRENKYKPLPVRRVAIPKRGEPNKTRPLGIPSIYDRVVQQALVNRLEPIFEELFDESSFGYRKGRQQRDALGKIWNEVQQGNEWIVDADLKDFFGSVDHDKLMTLVAQRVSDSRILQLIESMLKAGYMEKGRLFPTGVGTPQGGVISPLLSNILLTPFDKEMRRKGYRLTRWADDWVITCKSRAEANHALITAKKILEQLGVTLNMKKTRIVNISYGFEFLGFKIGKGKGNFRLNASQITSKLNKINLYAIPTDKAVKRFEDAIRQRTKRRRPLSMEEMIEDLNSLIRGWGNYFKRSRVRTLFNQLDHWIIRRLWSHHFKKWRCFGWKLFPSKKLREMGLVSLISLIPSLRASRERSK